MSFLRHREIYRPMWHFHCGNLGATSAVAPTHRPDEFPADYSLASCSPAELASASPAVRSMIGFIPVGNGLPANGNLSLFVLSQRWGAHQKRAGRLPVMSPDLFGITRHVPGSPDLFGNTLRAGGV
jgi:hypothetical protein